MTKNTLIATALGFALFLGISGALAAPAQAVLINGSTQFYYYSKPADPWHPPTRPTQNWYRVVYPDDSFYYSFSFPKPYFNRTRQSYGF